MSQDENNPPIKFIDANEERVAHLLDLGDARTQQIVCLQHAGNTSRFEDIAIRLEFITAENAKKKLRSKMFRRAYSQEVMSGLTALIFLVAAGSLVHDVATGIGHRQVAQRKEKELPEAIIRLRILPYLETYEEDIFRKAPWNGYTITVKNLAKQNGPGSILMIGNAGARYFSGCLSGTAQLKDTSLHLDRVIGEKTDRGYPPHVAVAYVTSYTYYRPTWNRDDIEFDLGCDGVDDHTHMGFDLVDL